MTATNVGILLIQLGTPARPTGWALRPYLRQFLSDRRVIEVPRLIWWPLLNGIILTTRPWRSAAKYRRIWDAETGSPLMKYTKAQVAGIQQAFANVPVRFAMQYGEPSVKSVLDPWIQEGLERLIVLPMYPQYSATTFAAATDALYKYLLTIRKVPSVRIVPPYFEHPAYIQPLATIVRQELESLGWTPQHFILSYHGIPRSYTIKGDPYARHVNRTTQLLVQELGWTKGMWTRTFQSRFGPQVWLKPYTDDVLESLAKKGIKRVFAVMPGFTADCLETIDEIGHESLEMFQEHGGEKLHACKCLNDHPAWIDGMVRILHEEGHGWLPN